jgi:hypothetical protein
MNASNKAGFANNIRLQVAALVAVTAILIMVAMKYIWRLEAASVGGLFAFFCADISSNLQRTSILELLFAAVHESLWPRRVI